jgi:hypothetical protein
VVDLLVCTSLQTSSYVAQLALPLGFRDVLFSVSGSKLSVHILDDGRRPEVAAMARRLRFQARQVLYTAYLRPEVSSNGSLVQKLVCHCKGTYGTSPLTQKITEQLDAIPVPETSWSLATAASVSQAHTNTLHSSPGIN